MDVLQKSSHVSQLEHSRAPLGWCRLACQKFYAVISRYCAYSFVCSSPVLQMQVAGLVKAQELPESACACRVKGVATSAHHPSKNDNTCARIKEPVCTVPQSNTHECQHPHQCPKHCSPMVLSHSIFVTVRVMSRKQTRRLPASRRQAPVFSTTRLLVVSDAAAVISCCL